MTEGTQHSSTNDDGNTPTENFAANLNPQPCDAATDGDPTQEEKPDVNSETDSAPTQEEKPDVNSETDSAPAQAEEPDVNLEYDSAFDDDDE
jgi:hypothetical protein